MRRRTVIGSVGAAALGVVGVSAYTNATVERDVSLTVQNDDTAVLQLNAGVGATLTNGKLALDADTEALNRAATFEYGDTSDPSANAAFTLTNADDQQHDVTISISKSSSNGHTLTLYSTPDGGTTVNTGSQTYTVSASGTVEFAFAMDTADSNGDYSGTLTFDAA